MNAEFSAKISAVSGGRAGAPVCESSQMIRRMISAAGGADILARKMRESRIVTQMDRPVLEHWTRVPESFDGIDPVTRTLRLIQATGSLLPLYWLCGRLGCHFVHGPGHFDSFVGKGAVTWFTASLQLHEIRHTAIRAFLRDNPGNQPDISQEEGRLMAKCWASVFAWIEGYLSCCQGDEVEVTTLNSATTLKPVLFRTTESWRAIAECLEGKSREAVSEAIAYPFGEASRNSRGDLRYPKKDILDKWAQSRGEDGSCAHGSRGPLDYTLALCVVTNSIEPIIWLANSCGGYVVRAGHPLARKGGDSEHLLLWERTMVELAELDASIASTLLDQSIDDSEVTRLRQEWADVVAWMGAFAVAW